MPNLRLGHTRVDTNRTNLFTQCCTKHHYQLLIRSHSENWSFLRISRFVFMMLRWTSLPASHTASFGKFLVYRVVFLRVLEYDCIHPIQNVWYDQASGSFLLPNQGSDRGFLRRCAGDHSWGYRDVSWCSPVVSYFRGDALKKLMFVRNLKRDRRRYFAKIIIKSDMCGAVNEKSLIRVARVNIISLVF